MIILRFYRFVTDHEPPVEIHVAYTVGFILDPILDSDGLHTAKIEELEVVRIILHSTVL